MYNISAFSYLLIFSLDLKTTVVVRRKTQSKEMESLFCELKNEYPCNVTYQTTRLACLLENDGNILWDSLLLSNAMIFPST
jgi:hypothetical protein